MSWIEARLDNASRLSRDLLGRNCQCEYPKCFELQNISPWEMSHVNQPTLPVACTNRDVRVMSRERLCWPPDEPSPQSPRSFTCISRREIHRAAAMPREELAGVAAQAWRRDANHAGDELAEDDARVHVVTNDQDREYVMKIKSNVRGGRAAIVDPGDGPPPGGRGCG